LQQTVLTRVSDVMNTYYDLVNQQQQLRAYDTAVRISAQRVELAQNRFTIGKASRLEVLNAQVDFNTDTTNLIRQNQFYNNTQIALNELLARDVNIRFTVSDSIYIDDKLTYAQLAELVQQQNPTLQAAIINKRIAELDLKQVRSDRYPEISLNSGYNFNNSQSALGFATQSSGRGLNYGVTASVNIFNGFNQRRLEKNAGILIENAQLQLEQTNLNLQSQLSTAFQTYATALALVKLEEKNQAIAKRNLEITVDKFKLGSIRPIEFREAQLNYVNSNVRYSNSQYAAKLAEIALKEIAGNVSL
jgi:outer membrane protein TolC